MAKSYFSHDSNARNSNELIKLRMKHGAAGYGIYFMLLERLREADNYIENRDYTVLAFEFQEDEELIRSVVEDFNLFVVGDESFYSEGFLKRMKIKDDIAEKRKKAGRKGGLKTQGEKAQSSKTEANAKQNESNAKAIKVNKSKVNKNSLPIVPLTEKRGESDLFEIPLNDMQENELVKKYGQKAFDKVRADLIDYLMAKGESRGSEYHALLFSFKRNAIPLIEIKCDNPDCHHGYVWPALGDPNQQASPCPTCNSKFQLKEQK